MTVIEGGSATFQLELSQEGVTGEWAQGGVRLHPGPKCHIYSEGRTHRLVLSDLGLADSGCVSFTADTLRCAARLSVRGVASGPMPANFLCVTTDLTNRVAPTDHPAKVGNPWTLWICLGPYNDHLAYDYSVACSPANRCYNEQSRVCVIPLAYLSDYS